MAQIQNYSTHGELNDSNEFERIVSNCQSPSSRSEHCSKVGLSSSQRGGRSEMNNYTPSGIHSTHVSLVSSILPIIVYGEATIHVM